MDEELYYVQDTRQIVGNAVLWWAQDGHGYTCDIEGAHVFTKKEADNVCLDPEGYRRHFTAWPKKYVDGNTVKTVDASHMSSVRAGITHLSERPKKVETKRRERCHACGVFVPSDPNHWRYRDAYNCPKCDASLLS